MSKTKNKYSKAKKIAKEAGLFAADILYNAIIIIILVVIIRSYLISPFRVIGSSMADTLQNNEFILIDKLSYKIGEPERGDPIVFLPPITNKYGHKFEEIIKTDEKGVGSLDLSELKAKKNVIYCQGALAQKFWFCKEGVYENDIVYFHQREKEGRQNIIWKNAEKQYVSNIEETNKELTIEGKPNTEYNIRIYSYKGPEFFVKRILGVPGDIIKIENGRLYRKNGDGEFEETLEEYLNSNNKNQTYFSKSVEDNVFIVPEGHVFTLGDNRNHSNDSRSWFAPITQEHTPFVPMENINGRVLTVLWPFSAARLIPGSDI